MKLSERETTVQEQLTMTLWSPGFGHVLGLISKRYDALVYDATHNLSSSEKNHYATVLQLTQLRNLVADMFALAGETPPESVRVKLNMKE